MNGQRFHQQKRIAAKTEQCERSLRFSHLFSACIIIVRIWFGIFPSSKDYGSWSEAADLNIL